MQRKFEQMDVFASSPWSGNPLAVVVDGDGLSDDEMHRFANWTNLSETTFIVPPTVSGADYRVRIFTTTVELPFAGHPTLGTCRAWLDHGGRPTDADTIVQQCGAGLVTIRRDRDRLAFAAPPLVRSGPIDDALRDRIERTLGTAVVDAAWCDNGPGWVAALLTSADAVLALEPDFGDTLDLKLGVVGPVAGSTDADHDLDRDHDWEIRAFFPGPTSMQEDPVTGSLNASVAQWLMGRDETLRSYVARQGTALGRSGRVHLTRDGGEILVGGAVIRRVSGHVEL
jgi:PhzF family phenazine biosynthesis protein